MKYKGILFDLDGVICDTAKLHFQAWKFVANKLGGDIDEEFNEKLKGVDRVESLRRILQKNKLELSKEQFDEIMNEKNNYYIDSLKVLNETSILPGICSFISELKENDIKIAIASASKNATIILKQIGLWEQIDTIACPSNVSFNKPAPDIFLLAAKQLGLNPGECLGIEDSQSGIEALTYAKIDSISIGLKSDDATVKLKDTSQLTIEILKEMSNRYTRK